MTHVLDSNNVDPMLLRASGGYMTTGASAAPSDNTAGQAAEWQAIEDKLIDWGSQPAHFDDDYLAPTSHSITRAFRLAATFRERGITPPTSVRPDANGGIVFELRYGKNKEVIRLWEDNSVEIFVFKNGKIASRAVLVDSDQ